MDQGPLFPKIHSHHPKTSGSCRGGEWIKAPYPQGYTAITQDIWQLQGKEKKRGRAYACAPKACWGSKKAQKASQSR